MLEQEPKSFEDPLGLKNLHLTRQQVLILNFVRMKGGVKLLDIWKFLDVSTRTAKLQVETLMQKGFLVCNNHTYYIKASLEEPYDASH